MKSNTQTQKSLFCELEKEVKLNRDLVEAENPGFDFECEWSDRVAFDYAASVGGCKVLGANTEECISQEVATAALRHAISRCIDTVVNLRQSGFSSDPVTFEAKADELFQIWCCFGAAEECFWQALRSNEPVNDALQQMRGAMRYWWDQVNRNLDSCGFKDAVVAKRLSRLKKAIRATYGVELPWWLK